MLESLDSVPRARLKGAEEPGQNGPSPHRRGSAPGAKGGEPGKLQGQSSQSLGKHTRCSLSWKGSSAAAEALPVVLTAPPGCRALPAVLNVRLAPERCPWS